MAPRAKGKKENKLQISHGTGMRNSKYGYLKTNSISYDHVAHKHGTGFYLMITKIFAT